MIKKAIISTDRLLRDLAYLVGLPGSSGDNDALAETAHGVAGLMRRYDLQTEIITTPGAPIIIGRRAGRHPFTLLLYHHYDVPPTGPWRAWHHEPFQMAERESTVYGRGVATGKGPLVAHLAALAALLESEGELPCNVTIVVDGEGLIGSPHLGPVVAEHQALLRADGCLATGGERDPQGRPFCYSGVKGFLQLRLSANGANQALPPGMAASVPNPLWRLLWALGHIKSDQEEVLISDFYNDMEVPNRVESQAIRSVALNEVGRLSAWGLAQFLFAMGGSTLARTETTMPTCNITALTVEPSSEIAAIPITASARLDFQLVPRQHPQVITDLLRQHLLDKQFDDIVVEQLPGGYPGMHTPFDHPFITMVCEMGQHVYQAPLLVLPRGPFAQPLFFFAEAFDMPVATLGCARPDSAINAANEHIPVTDLVHHGQLLIDLLKACTQNLALLG